MNSVVTVANHSLVCSLLLLPSFKTSGMLRYVTEEEILSLNQLPSMGYVAPIGWIKIIFIIL